MTKSLDEKVAIVTGASRNLGRAFSEMLATEGASVVVHYNDPNKKSEADNKILSLNNINNTKVFTPFMNVLLLQNKYCLYIILSLMPYI
jgi:NAD(P)-dependent dehydrogenase (short-subunit alcohol dehydrogenase family)